MPSDARTSLADEQARLVESLTAGGAAPRGFDTVQVATAAQSLKRKRSRGVARTWPALAKSLGQRFEDLFARYAQMCSQPAEGYADDGGRFAEWLMRAGELPDEGRVEWLARRVRRGCPFRIMRRQAGGWIVAVRMWRQGVRIWTSRDR